MFLFPASLSSHSSVECLLRRLVFSVANRRSFLSCYSLPERLPDLLFGRINIDYCNSASSTIYPSITTTATYDGLWTVYLSTSTIFHLPSVRWTFVSSDIYLFHIPFLFSLSSIIASFCDRFIFIFSVMVLKDFSSDFSPNNMFNIYGKFFSSDFLSDNSDHVGRSLHSLFPPRSLFDFRSGEAGCFLLVFIVSSVSIIITTVNNNIYNYSYKYKKKHKLLNQISKWKTKKKKNHHRLLLLFTWITWPKKK